MLRGGVLLGLGLLLGDILLLLLRSLLLLRLLLFRSLDLLLRFLCPFSCISQCTPSETNLIILLLLALLLLLRFQLPLFFSSNNLLLWFPQPFAYTCQRMLHETVPLKALSEYNLPRRTFCLQKQPLSSRTPHRGPHPQEEPLVQLDVGSYAPASLSQCW